MDKAFNSQRISQDPPARTLAAFDLAWQLAGEASLAAIDGLYGWSDGADAKVDPLAALGVRTDNAALLLGRIRAQELAARRFVGRVLEGRS